jgi:hypothetical protein
MISLLWLLLPILVAHRGDLATAPEGKLDLADIDIAIQSQRVHGLRPHSEQIKSAASAKREMVTRHPTAATADHGGFPFGVGAAPEGCQWKLSVSAATYGGLL